MDKKNKTKKYYLESKALSHSIKAACFPQAHKERQVGIELHHVVCVRID